MRGLDLRFLSVVAAALVAATGCSVAAEAGEDETTEEAVLRLENPKPVSYDAVLKLEGDALRDALKQITGEGYRRLGYTNAKRVLFNAPALLDEQGEIECYYTARKVKPNGSTGPGGLNTEHTWPQSQGASREPMKSDLHHLFPTDSRANSSRGNWPFGTAECLHDENGNCNFEEGGSALGKDDAGRLVFEVRKERRGNIARAKFYMAVRYDWQIPEKEEAVLRQWHDEDPVDAPEVVRNDEVQRNQANRNPFVDHPEFVAKISDF